MYRLLMACGGLQLAAVVTEGSRPVPVLARPSATRSRWEYQMLTPTAIEGLRRTKSGPLDTGPNNLDEERCESAAIEPGHVFRRSSWPGKRPCDRRDSSHA
jgi:hypothetical protein